MPETAREPEISRYRGQRGPDKKQRDFPLHTLKNLPQFRNKSHDEVRQYILETKGIDIGSNTHWNKIGLLVLLGLLVAVGGIGVWKLYGAYKRKQKDKEIVSTE